MSLSKGTLRKRERYVWWGKQSSNEHLPAPLYPVLPDTTLPQSLKFDCLLSDSACFCAFTGLLMPFSLPRSYWPTTSPWKVFFAGAQWAITGPHRRMKPCHLQQHGWNQKMSFRLNRPDTERQMLHAHSHTWKPKQAKINTEQWLPQAVAEERWSGYR